MRDCVKLNTALDSEMKVYYVTQGVNIRTKCHNYVLLFRNTKSHLLQVHLAAWVKIAVVFKCYPSTYCLMQGNRFICSDLKFEHFTPK